MKAKYEGGGGWPTCEQQLLLRAALLQSQEAIAAWEQWKASVDIDCIDMGSYRLLPLLYQNLSACGVNDPLMAKFKGIYRLTWCQNQILFHRILAVLRAFQEAGIETMLLKGPALILHYYKDYGLRPMSDFDILVPTADATAAMRLLEKMGWTTKVKMPERFVDCFHSLPFYDESRRQCDLHWHIFHECLQKNADDDFWKYGISTKIGDVSTYALNPTDQLLHVCVHGSRGNLLPPIRWIADATMILQSSQAEIDWERLVAQAQNRQLVLRLKDTLTILPDLLDAPVPTSILQDIQKSPISAIERLEHQVITSQMKPGLSYLINTYFWYLRTGNNSLLRFKYLGYPKYLQYIWGLPHLWQLPFVVLWKTIRKISSKILGEKSVPIPSTSLSKASVK